MAKAYMIEVKPDGTKDEVLPVLREAELAGVFAEKPKRPEYLVKASRKAGEPSVDWMSHRAPNEFSFQHLQRLAKENGIDSFGKSADYLEEALRAKDVL